MHSQRVFIVLKLFPNIIQLLTSVVCFAYYAVYNLLASPECLPDLLQEGLAAQSVNEVFILTSFSLQPKTGSTVFSLYNPRDNSKFFEFTVQGKLNRGMPHLL